MEEAVILIKDGDRVMAFRGWPKSLDISTTVDKLPIHLTGKTIVTYKEVSIDLSMIAITDESGEWSRVWDQYVTKPGELPSSAKELPDA